MLFVCINRLAYSNFSKVAWNVAWRICNLGQGNFAKKENSKFGMLWGQVGMI